MSETRRAHVGPPEWNWWWFNWRRYGAQKAAASADRGGFVWRAQSSELQSASLTLKIINPFEQIQPSQTEGFTVFLLSINKKINNLQIKANKRLLQNYCSIKSAHLARPAGWCQQCTEVLGWTKSWHETQSSIPTYWANTSDATSWFGQHSVCWLCKLTEREELKSLQK